jgi:CHAD domain-containing protein
MTDAELHVLRTRYAEVMNEEPWLASGDDDETLHAFRLTCKRLRFALERVEVAHVVLRRAAALLSEVTDELGKAHDCTMLAELAKDERAPFVAAQSRRDRARHVSRAQNLWHDAFRANGALLALNEWFGDDGTTH